MTVPELAAALDINEDCVSLRERDFSNFGAIQGNAQLDVIEGIVQRRAALVAKGLALYASIADESYRDEKRPWTVRKPEEARTIRVASGRADEV
ncbi:MAG TPA: hypothetical protein VNF73_07325 [Candidatus Saccharimonadales bacterium]|nr:hypothetical protein [Candidatus Saccharimonadales bacterium]